MPLRIVNNNSYNDNSNNIIYIDNTTSVQGKWRPYSLGKRITEYRNVMLCLTHCGEEKILTFQ